jgi:uncharacterized membrane protein
VAAAVNWTLMQHLRGREGAPDMLPAVLLGALLSAAIALPLAWPLQASAARPGPAGMLGVVQLAIPCLLAVTVGRVLLGARDLAAGLLEVVFGVAWVWLGAGEAPTAAGARRWRPGAGALAANEALALRSR